MLRRPFALAASLLFAALIAAGAAPAAAAAARRRPERRHRGPRSPPTPGPLRPEAATRSSSAIRGSVIRAMWHAWTSTRPATIASPSSTSLTSATRKKDNRVEEYTLILYNLTAGAITAQIDAPINATAPATSALRDRRREARRCCRRRVRGCIRPGRARRIWRPRSCEELLQSQDGPEPATPPRRERPPPREV